MLPIAAIADDNEFSPFNKLLSSIASHGLTVDEYRAKIRGEIERTKVVNAMVRSRVQITDEEVRAALRRKVRRPTRGG